MLASVQKLSFSLILSSFALPLVNFPIGEFSENFEGEAWAPKKVLTANLGD